MSSVSLYIHIPWCIRKCPYCDFNSHKSPGQLPEQDYIDALLADFKQDHDERPYKEISTIFIGGGTPSLFSAKAYEYLFNQLTKQINFNPKIEITLEANPGTVEQQRFADYRQLGINRLSLGIQSFNPKHLRKLGRIHDENQARKAIETARLAGFSNLNIDIMHSLPEQTVNEGLVDLREAISWQPEHISWYQLTLEPNTIFYKQRPVLPDEEDNDALENAGFSLLNQAGYSRYEISAFCQPDKHAQHNLNYWLFGDYYGIGAGAHGKLTDPATGNILRTQKYRQPKDYLNLAKKFLCQKETVSVENIIFEFMLNTSRLHQPIAHDLFTARTGIAFDLLAHKLQRAAAKGLIQMNETNWQITDLGRRFTNDLQAMFLP